MLSTLLMFCQYEGKKNPAGIKLQYFCPYGERKNQPTKEQS
jgi:hypothetical protein